MTSAQIRQSYLDFFASKKHTIVPSSSLMPDAPNLLFTNAGMNQFVPIFLGEMDCPYKPGRAADTQKCIRAGGKHNDLEDVGLDTYHHTFFEMLGNWSFGDYFKKEAISWAWELVVGVWKFPANRVYATVYKPGANDPASFDQEAYDMWAEIFTKAGLDPQVHIVYGNKKDNFWMMGDTGPCGPCSELHIDLTPEGDTKGSLVNKGDSRCIEIWNLVFIQFNANPDGTFSPLPAKHVDTGMGFERVTSIIQCTKNFTDFANAKISNYETDVFRPIFDALEKLSGKKYGSTLPVSGSNGANEQEKDDVAFRVISDHIRTLSFAVADGIIPSNEGRGYVLRRILRRAVRYGRQLGLHDLFFHKLVDVLADTMGNVFPEIRKNRDRVVHVIKAEEESFSKTLDHGLGLFQNVVTSVKDKTFPGDQAFKLYDTYGFPIDLTELMAREQGFTVDVASFEKLMEEQRQRSKAAQKKEIIEVLDNGENALKSEFVGFDQKEKVEIASWKYEIDPADPKTARVYFTPTPFYGEMGGQVGDEGYLEANGTRVKITDTRRGGSDIFIHLTHDVEALKKLEGAKLTASVDATRRGLIESHHSVTHIMHWALREVLGTGVGQKGSYVGPDRLRFDFSHIEAMKPEEIREVEKLVNERIKESLPVSWSQRPYSEVKGDSSVLQFFGDKYGEVVRVVDIGGFSKELCGGTHVRNTSLIGPFRIISEGAIAAGVRRIEAITGEALRPYLEAEFSRQDEHYHQLSTKFPDAPKWNSASATGDIASLWNTRAERHDLIAKVESDFRAWEKEQSKNKEAVLRKQAVELSASLLAQKQQAGDIPFIVHHLGQAESALLQILVDTLKKDIKGAIVLAAESNGKVALIAQVDPAFSKKIQAGKIIQNIAPLVGGKGGGRPELAQGGGTNASGIPASLAKAAELIKG